MPDPRAPGAAPAAKLSTRRRWFWVAGLIVFAGAVMSLARSGGQPGRGPGTVRVVPVMLPPEEFAQAVGGGAHPVRVNPPIDVIEAERWASRIPLLNVPLPEEREVETWRLGGGVEVTQVVLYYNDAAEGARLESMAGTLLSTGLGLQQRPLALRGADSALGWSGEGFVGASFRRGPFVVLVGVSGPAPAGAAEALAGRALLRVNGVLAAAEAAGATTAAQEATAAAAVTPGVVAPDEP